MEILVLMCNESLHQISTIARFHLCNQELIFVAREKNNPKDFWNADVIRPTD
jgi:hypothetical protein